MPKSALHAKALQPAALTRTEPVNTGNRWLKGQSGNPAGRPVGAREKLVHSFIDELVYSFERKGRKVIDKLADSDPATYARIIASLVPKEVRLDAGPLASLGQAELDALAHAARKAVEQAKA